MTALDKGRQRSLVIQVESDGSTTTSTLLVVFCQRYTGIREKVLWRVSKPSVSWLTGALRFSRCRSAVNTIYL